MLCWCPGVSVSSWIPSALPNAYVNALKLLLLLLFNNLQVAQVASACNCPSTPFRSQHGSRGCEKKQETTKEATTFIMQGFLPLCSNFTRIRGTHTQCNIYVQQPLHKDQAPDQLGSLTGLVGGLSDQHDTLRGCHAMSSPLQVVTSNRRCGSCEPQQCTTVKLRYYMLTCYMTVTGT